jgi:hypothetical protein
MLANGSTTMNMYANMRAGSYNGVTSTGDSAMQ